jgi:hypothetical protein
MSSGRIPLDNAHAIPLILHTVGRPGQEPGIEAMGDEQPALSFTSTHGLEGMERVDWEGYPSPFHVVGRVSFQRRLDDTARFGSSRAVRMPAADTANQDYLFPPPAYDTCRAGMP